MIYCYACNGSMCPQNDCVTSYNYVRPYSVWVTFTMTLCNPNINIASIKMPLYNLHNDSLGPHNDLCALTILQANLSMSLCAFTMISCILRNYSCDTMTLCDLQLAVWHWQWFIVSPRVILCALTVTLCDILLIISSLTMIIDLHNKYGYPHNESVWISQ